jgi:hypothetical protein
MKRASFVAVGLGLLISSWLAQAQTATLAQAVTTWPGVVRVVDPCPTGGQGAEGSQDEMLPTLGVVQEYMKPELGPSSGTRVVGQDRANLSSRFGSAGMAALDRKWVVFLQAVGDDAVLAAHAAALTKLVPKPDRTVVCRVALSEARFEELRRLIGLRIAGSPAGLVYGIDRTADGRILVRLSPRGEALAQSLAAEFGNEIAINLGHLAWPSQTLRDGKIPYGCEPVPQNANQSLKIRTPKRLSMQQGAATKFQVTAKNAAAVPEEMPRLVARVSKVGSRLPVSADARGFAFTLASVSIQPGKSMVLTAEVFTDSCDPKVGYSLPPGKYHVFLVDALGRPESRVVSGPIPLTITK